MANRALIHSSTRVILHLTTDNSRQAQAGSEYIPVVESFDLGGGPWKLEMDNATKVAPTQQEVDAVKDYLNPDRVTTRELKNKALALYRSTQSQELKAFLVAFRDWVKDVV